MSEYAKNIVYLSAPQYAELIANNTITVDDVTVTYNDNDIYVTPQAEPITDVQIDGTSIVSSGVANVPFATASEPGVAKFNSTYGIAMNNSGGAYIRQADDGYVRQGVRGYNPICPSNQHKAVFYGLAKVAGADMASLSSVPVGTYPEAQKSAISEMLNGAVSVSGTTPTITAKPGVRYICGQVDTLTIVAPSSGCIDVTFESGSTPTVLTVTPPSGMMMKWANGFDPTALEANTTYEINILDGCLGVAGSWT